MSRVDAPDLKVDNLEDQKVRDSDEDDAPPPQANAQHNGLKPGAGFGTANGNGAAAAAKYASKYAVKAEEVRRASECAASRRVAGLTARHVARASCGAVVRLCGYAVMR